MLIILFNSPEFVTDSESSVLLLYCNWCEGSAGKSCSEEQLAKLNGAIRYARIPPSFLTQMGDSLSSPHLSRTQLLELWCFQSFPELLQPQAVPADHPTPGWFLPSRAYSPIGRIAVLKLAITAADLARLFDSLKTGKAVSIVSGAVYAAGYAWVLQFLSGGGYLWCVVVAKGVTSLMQPKLAQTLVSLPQGVACKFSIKVDGPSPIGLISTDCTLLKGCVVRGVNLSELKGSGTFPAANMLNSMAGWDKHMVNGSAHLTATVTDIC